jgi:pimeloyl-ACP methyl ester carboxylesterase
MLYAEVRGAGPAILLVAGGAEDAEGWRGVAERLPDHTVVTYDRRGTLRSGREDWPGRGSGQHADDAAALLDVLGLDDVVVFGGSSAGIIAVQVALRHPQRVRRVLAYEPGYLRMLPEGLRLQGLAAAGVERHLAKHPDDWSGAYDSVLGVLASGLVPGSGGSIVAIDAEAWFAHRERGNAEAFSRDDVPILTAEAVDAAALAASPVDIRFASGSRSVPLFRDIVERLAALRRGGADVIDGAGHGLYLEPELAAAFLRERTG